MLPLPVIVSAIKRTEPPEPPPDPSLTAADPLIPFAFIVPLKLNVSLTLIITTPPPSPPAA